MHRIPDLTLLDATVGMPDYHLGGCHCDPPVNKIVASFDAFEADRAGARLPGFDWKRIGHLAGFPRKRQVSSCSLYYLQHIIDRRAVAPAADLVYSTCMKVYPAMNRFVRENVFDEDGWVMEIYDMPDRKIVYRKEIFNR